MKKLSLIAMMTAVAAVLMFASCGKEPVEEPTSQPSTGAYVPEDYAEYMMGPWEVVLDSSYTRYAESDGYEELTYCQEWASRMVLTIKADGKLNYMAVVGGVEDSWDDVCSIQGDTLVWDVRSYGIKATSESRCEIESTITENRTTAGGTVYTTSETKHYTLHRM